MNLLIIPPEFTMVIIGCLATGLLAAAGWLVTHFIMKNDKSIEAANEEASKANEEATKAMVKAVFAIQELEVLKSKLSEQHQSMTDIEAEFKEMTKEFRAMNKGLNDLMLVLAAKGIDGLKAM